MAVSNVAQTLQHLREKRTQFSDAAGLAKNSKQAYAYAWSIFSRWTASMGMESLPASSETLAYFVAAQLDAGRKATTVRHRLVAVQRMHTTCHHAYPGTPELKDMLRGARRLTGEKPRRVLAITVEELRGCALLLLADKTPIAIRNRSLILTGFTAALRNSDSAGLRVGDIEFCAEGAIVHIRRGKTDQDGNGRDVGLLHGKHPETDVVQALKDWIAICGSSADGPLFTRFDGNTVKDRSIPLRPARIGQIVQEQARRAGLAWTKMGGHSLRSGYATEAGIAGAPDRLVAATTGHRNMAILATYFRKRNVFIANPLGLLDL